MTSERLRNRLAKVEERSSSQSYVVFYEDGESAFDVHTRAAGLGRPVVLMPRPIADTAEWLRKCGPANA